MVALGLALTVAQKTLAGRFIINFTPSIPRGIYWLRVGERPRPGDLVAFPVPEHVRELVYQREYVPRHVRLLSKPVVAVGGDHVCARAHTLEVNGRHAGNILELDRGGRLMPQYAGCGVLPDDEIFVATEHDNSFDSRYFGPVAMPAIRGTLLPLLTF